MRPYFFCIIPCLHIPTTRNELQKLYSNSQWYSRFLPSFRTRTGITNCQLQRKDQADKTITWTTRMTQKFNDICEEVNSNPKLFYPDFGKSFTLFTNASNKGLGWYLVQEDSAGQKQMIMMGHRTLTQTGENKSTTDGKLMALKPAANKIYFNGRPEGKKRNS